VRSIEFKRTPARCRRKAGEGDGVAYMESLYLLIFIDHVYRNYGPMNSFYITIFYPITYILFSFSINHIHSYLGSRVDIVSNLDLVSMIFALSLQ
jgi:hypothetical protein